MTDTIKPIAYCCINRQGDITSTIKHKDGWRKAPLYDESAIEQARQEGRDEFAMKLSHANIEIAELRRQLAATQADNAALHSAAHRLALESECFYLDCEDMPILSKWTEPMLNAISEVQKTRWESGTSAIDALLTAKERETIERCAKVCMERGERSRIAAGKPNGDRDEFYCADDIRALAS